MSDREIAQRMLTQCVAGRTHQIARIVSSRYDQALKDYGVTSNQLTLLCLVGLLQPAKPRDMLPYLKMEQSTLSRNLDRMIRQGWLRRKVDKDDSRSVEIELTREGAAKMRAARKGWDAAQEWALDALGNAGIGGLDDAANRLNPLMPLAKRG